MLILLPIRRCSQDNTSTATKGTSLIDSSNFSRKRSRKDFKALHSSSAEILHRYAKCVLSRRPHQCQVSIVVKHQTINTVPAGIQCVWSVFSIDRYDIKGCEVSRWTDPAPVGSQIIVVLKDLNFEGQYIHLGKKRDRLSPYKYIDLPSLWVAGHETPKEFLCLNSVAFYVFLQTANVPGYCGRWRSTLTSYGGWTCWTTACFWLSSRYTAMNAARVSLLLPSLWEQKCELPQVLIILR